MGVSRDYGYHIGSLFYGDSTFWGLIFGNPRYGVPVPGLRFLFFAVSGPGKS